MQKGISIRKYISPSIVFVLSLTTVFIGMLLYLGIVLVQIPSSKEVEIPIVQLPKTGIENYRVFVTSGNYTGNLGGLGGADQICNQLAYNAGHCGVWRVWLSSDSFDASSRIRDIEYYLVDSSVSGEDAYQICSDLTDLTDGEIMHSILRQEDGIDKPQPPPGDPPEGFGSVWTGTEADGTRSGTVPNDFCGNWASNTDSISAGIGTYYNYSSDWTEASLQTCDKSYPLYCFEYSKDADCDGYYREVDDCDDMNDSINPGADELCNQVDDNCDDLLDEGFSHIPETCNGVDDNCNGRIDENLTHVCGSAVGECVQGIQTCEKGSWGFCIGGITPRSEVCDGEDNDCDDLTDENLKRSCGVDIGICTIGAERCENGNWGNCNGVQAQIEVCDGLDNDCDGITDEECSCDSGSTQQCGSDVGICNIGTQWCEDGIWGDCYGAVLPRSEVCDGLDNDCDGITDESLRLDCGSNVGSCTEGIQICVDGAWGDCSGGSEPSDEICDKVDNDCNGAIDEGCSCNTGDERDCGLDVGGCEKGIQHCIDGIWGNCDGSLSPVIEICDDKDNDCDGNVDEGYVCEELGIDISEDAEDLVVERSFLESIISGIKDKKVIIFSIFISSLVLIGAISWFYFVKRRESLKIGGVSGKRHKTRKKSDYPRSPLD